ncbi:MAG: hypothetical protein GXP25_17490 [Planctomycetes bacterium]|nr:hypothetical protein [Planctomycetota bacterium]
MPRVGRVFFDGAVYHVYNRIARGEHALGVDVSQLAGRGRGEATVRTRDLLASLGAECFGLQVKADRGGAGQAPRHRIGLGDAGHPASAGR